MEGGKGVGGKERGGGTGTVGYEKGGRHLVGNVFVFLFLI